MDKNLGIFDHLNKTFGELWSKKNLTGKLEEKNTGTADGTGNIDGVDKQEATYWSLLNETRNRKGERRRSSSRDKAEGNLRPGERKLKKENMGNQESLNGVVPKEELEQYIPLSDKGGSVKNSSGDDDASKDKENRAVGPDADANKARRSVDKRIPKVGENKTRVVKSGEKILTVYSREEYVDSKKVEGPDKRLNLEINNGSVEKKLERRDSDTANTPRRQKKIIGDNKQDTSEPAFAQEFKHEETDGSVDPVKESKPNTIGGTSKLPEAKDKTSDKKTGVSLGSAENLPSEEVKKFLKNMGKNAKSDENPTSDVNAKKTLDKVMEIANSKDTVEKDKITAPTSEHKKSLLVENKISDVLKPANPCYKTEEKSVKNEVNTRVESEKSSPIVVKPDNESSKIPKLENPSKILASISAGMDVRRTNLTKNLIVQEPVKQVTEKLISSVVCGHIMEVSEKNCRKLGTSSNNSERNDNSTKTDSIGTVEAEHKQGSVSCDKKEPEKILPNASLMEKADVDSVPVSKTEGKAKQTNSTATSVNDPLRHQISEVFQKDEEDGISRKEDASRDDTETVPVEKKIVEDTAKKLDWKSSEDSTEKFSNSTGKESLNHDSVATYIKESKSKEFAKIENNSGFTILRTAAEEKPCLPLKQEYMPVTKSADETNLKSAKLDNEKIGAIEKNNNTLVAEAPGTNMSGQKEAEKPQLIGFEQPKVANNDKTAEKQVVSAKNAGCTNESEKIPEKLVDVGKGSADKKNEGTESSESHQNVDKVAEQTCPSSKQESMIEKETVTKNVVSMIDKEFQSDNLQNEKSEKSNNEVAVEESKTGVSGKKGTEKSESISKIPVQENRSTVVNTCSTNSRIGNSLDLENPKDVKIDKLIATNDKQEIPKLTNTKQNKNTEAEEEKVQTAAADVGVSEETEEKITTKLEMEDISKLTDSKVTASISSNKILPTTEGKLANVQVVDNKQDVLKNLKLNGTTGKEKDELSAANIVNAEPGSIVNDKPIAKEASVSKVSEGIQNDVDKSVKDVNKKPEDPEIDELKRLLLDKLKLANSAPITTTGIKDAKKCEAQEEKPKINSASPGKSPALQKAAANRDTSATEDKKEILVDISKVKLEVPSHELNIITEEEREKGTQSSLSNRSSVDLDSRAMSPFSEAGSGTATPRRRRSVKSRRQSSGNKSSSESTSRRGSRAFSPFESNSRRGSRALSPLSSFSNIQEKIQALSRDSSQSEIAKKTPKIHKLDDKVLMIGKEPSKTEKSKEAVKVTPKIDATLQSKILKFGVPSGAKIPKKTEPMKAERSYSVIGGLTIKDPDEGVTVTDSSKVKPYRRNKPKAPPPPGQQEKTDGGNEENESVPTTPTADRHGMKVKKVKGKAPPPPIQNIELSTEAAKVREDVVNMTNEINQLLQETKNLHKETKTLPTSPTAKRRSSKPGTPSSVRKLSLMEGELKENKNSGADDNNNKVVGDKKRRSSKSELLKNLEMGSLTETKIGEKKEKDKILQEFSITKQMDSGTKDGNNLTVDDKKRVEVPNKVDNLEESQTKKVKKDADRKKSESAVEQTVSDKDSKKTSVTEVVVKKTSEKLEKTVKNRSVDDKGVKETSTLNKNEDPILKEVVKENVSAPGILTLGLKVDDTRVKTERKMSLDKQDSIAADSKNNQLFTNNKRRSSKTELVDQKETIGEPKTDNPNIVLTPESQGKAPVCNQNASKEKKVSGSAVTEQPQLAADFNKSKVATLSKSAKENTRQQKPHGTESKIPTLRTNEEPRGSKISPQYCRKDSNPAEDSISLASSSSRDSFETLKSSRSPSPSSYESCNEADKKKPEKEPEPQAEEKEVKPAVEKKVKYSSRGEVIPDEGTIRPLGMYKSILEPIKDSNTITLVSAYRPEKIADLPKPEEPKQQGKDVGTIPLSLAIHPENSEDVPKPEEPKSKTHSLIESIRKQLQSSEILKIPENEPKSEDDLSLSDSLTISYGAVRRKPSADLTTQDNKFEKYERHLKRYEEMFSPERAPFTPEGTPFSDFSDDSYDHYVTSDYSLDSSVCENQSSRRSSRCSSTPRRIFPQIAKPSLYEDNKTKEDSPVIFDAGLSFDLCSKRSRTPVRQLFQPQPAFSEPKTVSNSLSTQIADFLNRTDHVMEEWKRLGKSDSGDLKSCVELPSYASSGHPKSKSKSATNIMIKGLLNYSRGSSVSSVRSPSRSRYSESSDRTLSDLDELSEMAVDLTEERATANLQAERLEAETAERIRLEQELSQIQHERKNLQQTSERLEMELFYARADVNGLSEGEADLEDGNADAGIYKQKCERIMRELEFTRRRLQQQHEDDLEQLVGLKKQLEKKLSDAYEEVEEQRQVVGQWKRKVQKLQAEMNDLRLLLEEQSSRNNLLEKKQRKFDSEIQMLQDELRSEKNQRDRASREKEIAVGEKYSMEQNLSSVRLELELKEEKLAALTRELDDLSRGGGSEQEVTQLRKAKHDLELKLKEQEEELDELAGQVSMLEGNKLRLEMSLESLRKDHRREMTQRDDELDEVRSNGHKKVKALESQLESEHEERTLLLREKHELERRLNEAEERGRHYRAADEDALLKLRRDLKKTKALLRDAQVMLERAKQDSPSKAALRALKNQLEDAELARASAVKAKQSLESELNEVNGQFEEALRAKGDAENRYQAAQRESNALRTQVDENEEELAELLKKYRSTVQQLSAEQLANQETAGALAEAEAERSSLRDQLAELTAKLEASSLIDPASGLAQKRLEIRIKELESRLELEQTTRGRLEVQIARLKENVERLTEECVQARTKEQAASDLTRKLQRSLRETKEELSQLQAKEQEFAHKKKDLEKRLETAEQEAMSARTDLRLAVKRIEDLQNAISGEIGSDSERSESDVDSDSGDDSLISQLPSGLSSARTSRTPDVTPR